jgi:hypothetical protein
VRYVQDDVKREMLDTYLYTVWKNAVLSVASAVCALDDSFSSPILTCGTPQKLLFTFAPEI